MRARPTSVGASRAGVCMQEQPAQAWGCAVHSRRNTDRATETPRHTTQPAAHGTAIQAHLRDRRSSTAHIYRTQDPVHHQRVAPAAPIRSSKLRLRPPGL